MNKYVQKGLRHLVKLDFFRNNAIKTYNKFKINPELEVHNLDAFESFKSNEIIDELNKNGFSSTFNLKKEFLDNIIEDCKVNKVIPLIRFDRKKIVNPKFYDMDFDNPISPEKDVIWYGYKDVLNWKSIEKLKKSKQLIDVVKSYLGNNPIIRNSSLWWSFPPIDNEGNTQDSSRYWFHYDIDDAKFLKLFIALKDVNENNGPHLIVKGTNGNKKWKYKLNRIVSSNKLNKGFFKDKEIISMQGKRGTCFFEDTFTYHNGSVPKQPRLLLQLEFCLTKHQLG